MNKPFVVGQRITVSMYNREFPAVIDLISNRNQKIDASIILDSGESMPVTFTYRTTVGLYVEKKCRCTPSLSGNLEYNSVDLSTKTYIVEE